MARAVARPPRGRMTGSWSPWMTRAGMRRPASARLRSPEAITAARWRWSSRSSPGWRWKDRAAMSLTMSSPRGYRGPGPDDPFERRPPRVRRAARAVPARALDASGSAWSGSGRHGFDLPGTRRGWPRRSTPCSRASARSIAGGGEPIGRTLRTPRRRHPARLVGHVGQAVRRRPARAMFLAALPAREHRLTNGSFSSIRAPKRSYGNRPCGGSPRSSRRIQPRRPVRHDTDVPWVPPGRHRCSIGAVPLRRFTA